MLPGLTPFLGGGEPPVVVITGPSSWAPSGPTGGTCALTATASGGTAPYTYGMWEIIEGSGAIFSPETGPNTTVSTSNRAETVSVRTSVTDAAGRTATSAAFTIFGSA